MDRKDDIPPKELIHMETSIEPAGDYVKYENKKFFENYHNVPRIEAPLFRGDAGDDESYDEEIREECSLQKTKVENSMKGAGGDDNFRGHGATTGHNIISGVISDTYSDDFLKRTMNHSAIEYDEMRRQVITRLNELGMVKSKYKNIQISNQNNVALRSDSCEKIADNICQNVQAHMNACSGDADEGQQALLKTERSQGLTSKVTSNGFFVRFGRSLTDIISRPRKKIGSAKARAESDTGH